jgi:Na+-translocating ferredoxin:NAD+ oxidoreductase RnfC subunit
LIPPGGIPLQVGVIVNNVETLANIARANAGIPVTQKTLTVAGSVNNPVTLTVPIGVTFKELIQLAGGPAEPDPVVCIGGLMMGETTEDLERPVTKTTTGIVVLPRNHPIIERKLKPAKAQAKIGKSACDQCRYCTEYCPRFLLGYAVEPHQVMRSLAFTSTGADYWNQWAAFCCSCGLCTLYACPEQLYPKEACDDAKAGMRALGVKPTGSAEVKVHPLREGRRVPIQSLMRRLSVKVYDNPAHWVESTLKPRQFVIPLKQSAGTACMPVVKAGDRVQSGQLLGTPPENALGARLHAPAAGTVSEITSERILIKIS